AHVAGAGHRPTRRTGTGHAVQGRRHHQALGGKVTSNEGRTQIVNEPANNSDTQETPLLGSVSHAWRALRHRNFKLFFAGQSISVIGTWMTRLATSWLVYRLTHSALLLGVVSFAGYIVSFALGPFAGVWVERLNRRKLLVWTQAAAAIQSL